MSPRQCYTWAPSPRKACYHFFLNYFKFLDYISSEALLLLKRQHRVGKTPVAGWDTIAYFLAQRLVEGLITQLAPANVDEILADMSCQGQIEPTPHGIACFR